MPLLEIALGLVVGLSLGALGGGGSILAVPLLVGLLVVVIALVHLLVTWRDT